MTAPEPHRPFFVGIGHKKQRGKDTFAHMLMMALGVTRSMKLSFADPLKQLAMNCFGLTFEQCHGTDEQKSTAVKITEGETAGPDADCDGGFVTARRLLQRLGVRARRMWPGIWSKAPIRRKYHDGIEFVVIPDVRFPDEVEAIKEADGVLIRVDRLGAPEDEHESEHALDDYTGWDWIVPNNWTLVELNERALTIGYAIEDLAKSRREGAVTT